VAANRRAVHDAAMRLLARHGIAGLTVDRLADVSGVSRSTIYRHWPDPRELAVEALEGVLRTEPTSLRAAPEDPASALLAYLRDYARRLNDETYATMLVTIIEWAWRDPDFARRHTHTLEDARSRAMKVVRDGRAAGLFRPDIDLNEAVEAVVSPFLYQRLVRRKRISDRDVRRLHAGFLATFATAPE
jgi:AcrR family transcriptional regulator